MSSPIQPRQLLATLLPGGCPGLALRAGSDARTAFGYQLLTVLAQVTVPAWPFFTVVTARPNRWFRCWRPWWPL
jgi:hypothetical protein